jgi:peroxiredoxin
MDPVIAPGIPAPDVNLRDLGGVLRCLEDQRGRLTVLNFWSAECPWSERTDAVALDAARQADADLWTIASCAGESQARILEVATERGLPVVLLDPDQAVADRYQAQATPHLYVIDADGVLRYRGAPDDAGFGTPAPTRSYLAEALHAIRQGRTPDPSETQAQGCAIVRRPPR